jgi:transposase
MRVAPVVKLNSEDDHKLRILSKRKRVQARVQQRARIVLLAARGVSDKDIALQLDCERRVAARWRARFLSHGIDGLLKDATRAGRPRTASDEATVQLVVRTTLEQKPKAATHWSTRSMATHLGIILIPIRNSINNPVPCDNAFNGCMLSLHGFQGLHQVIFKQVQRVKRFVVKVLLAQLIPNVFLRI